MTQTSTRPQATTLTGPAADIAAQVARLRRQAAARGQPMAMTLRDEPDGMVSARVVVGTQPLAPRSQPRHATVREGAPRGVLIGAAAVGAVALGGAVWLVIAALAWAADHAAQLIGFGVLLLVAYGAARRATGCPGLHCVGCSGH